MKNFKLQICCILGILGSFYSVGSRAQSLPNPPVLIYTITGTVDPFQNSDIDFHDGTYQEIVNGIVINGIETKTTIACDNSPAPDGSVVNLFGYCDKGSPTCATYSLAFNSVKTCRQVARCIMQLSPQQKIVLSGNLSSGKISISSLPQDCLGL